MCDVLLLMLMLMRFVQRVDPFRTLDALKQSFEIAIGAGANKFTTEDFYETVFVCLPPSCDDCARFWRAWRH